MSNRKTRIITIITALALILALFASCSKDAGNSGLSADGEKLFNTYEGVNLDDYIKVCDYKGISITRYDPAPTDEDVNYYIANLLSENMKLISVTDRAAENGDVVNIDFVGKCDNMATPDGMTGNNPSLELGSGAFIPGFEEGVVGMAIGETKDIHLTFPSYYPNNTELQDQPATFTVTLNSISTYELPEFNDYFVSTISDYTTVDEYLSYVNLQLYAENTAAGTATQRNEIWDYIIENSEALGYPEAEYNEFYNTFIDGYTSMVSQYGYDSLEQMVSESFGITMDEFYETAKEYARDVCFNEMVTIKVANEEGVTFTDEDYSAGVASYAEMYGTDAANFEAYYGKDMIARSLLIDKVCDKLIEYAVLTDPVAETVAEN